MLLSPNRDLQDMPVAADASDSPQLEEGQEGLPLQSTSKLGVNRMQPNAAAIGDVKEVAEWEKQGAKMMRFSPSSTADQNRKV